MKILLVCPQYPDTFWSFKHALKIISKKASFPPLGLLTVAAMLPEEWEKRLVDMNVTSLTDGGVEWADYVFVSAMEVQRTSVREVISQCHRLGTRVVAGGPLFTTEYDEFAEVDHLVLGEAEVTLPLFLSDLAAGCAKHIYPANVFPDIEKTPIPLWPLINMKHYSAMSIQYSRGCPFNCEFCDIIVLNGHKVRTKSVGQVIAELNVLREHGWHSGLFMVDDNFIGNKRKLKREILPAMISWAKSNNYPFTLTTEASINLADDKELMQLMVEAGFRRVFVGIETPNEDSLAECSKNQNKNRDLIACVKEMHRNGLEVQGGFIVGFDSDPLSIFQDQISFIEKSGIVSAMVGLLNAPRGTRLYERLKREGRLLKGTSGVSTDFSITDHSMNFIPKMNYQTLVDGYRNIVSTIYSPKHYYERIKMFLKEYKPLRKGKGNIEFGHLKAFIVSLWLLGFREKGRRYFWKLFISTLFKRPRGIPISMHLSVTGHHFRKVAAKHFASSVKESSPV